VTAYVLPFHERFVVRYFTAAGEQKSGGYAALAAAKALYFVGLAPPDQPLHLEGRDGQILIHPSASPAGELSLVLPPVKAEPPLWDWAQNPPAGLDQAAVLGLMTVGPYHLICLAERPAESLAATAAAWPLRESRLVFSWPLEQAGYELRCFGAAGEEAELPVDLDFHAALTPFWSRRQGRARLEIHHLAQRQALLRAELSAETVELAGQMQIVYKAAPTINELAGDSSPGDFF
jgi:predicted PhzF superfamily epimerase YddE/YHI9